MPCGSGWEEDADVCVAGPAGAVRCDGPVIFAAVELVLARGPLGVLGVASAEG